MIREYFEITCDEKKQKEEIIKNIKIKKILNNKHIVDSINKKIEKEQSFISSQQSTTMWMLQYNHIELILTFGILSGFLSER